MLVSKSIQTNIRIMGGYHLSYNFNINAIHDIYISSILISIIIQINEYKITSLGLKVQEKNKLRAI
jgi:hypothetical protein